MKPGDEQVWRRSASLASVSSADRIAVLDLDHLELPPVILEGSAAHIWSMLDGERDVASVLNVLSRSFPQSADELRAATVDFLAQLARLDLVAQSVAGGATSNESPSRNERPPTNERPS